jgi:NhaA family Na+:H+ antiporter
MVTGIGFTMSNFISMLAFSGQELLSAAKLSVLLGSLGGAALGLGSVVIILRNRRKRLR